MHCTTSLKGVVEGIRKTDKGRMGSGVITQAKTKKGERDFTDEDLTISCH